MNPIYRFMQSLPTNGYITIIGAILAIAFGVSGILTGHLDIPTGMASISLGLTGLGLGNKLEKTKAQYEQILGMIPPGLITKMEENISGQ